MTGIRSYSIPDVKKIGLFSRISGQRNSWCIPYGCNGEGLKVHWTRNAATLTAFLHHLRFKRRFFLDPLLET